MDDNKEKELREILEQEKNDYVIELRDGKESVSEEEPDDSAKSRLELYDWLQCIVSAVLCGILLFVFVGRVIGVDGSSMFDTLHDTDRVFMTDLFFKPEYGDIVVFHSDAYGDIPLVKRVIAVAGQTIDINFDTSEVIVDGVVLQEDYIYEEILTSRQDFFGPVTVPDGFLFVMGDNRNGSRDSRSDAVGLVDTRDILGKVLLITIPGKTEHEPRDWSRFGSVYN